MSAGDRRAPPVVLSGGRVTGRAGAVPVYVRDGRIVAIGRVPEPWPEDAARIDASRLVVAPGFVDAQINGAAGVDVTSAPERLDEVAAHLPRHGVTSFVPTVVSGDAATVRRALDAIARFRPPPGSARPLGLHLEGPMLNPLRRGAHPASRLRMPSPDVIDGWSADNGVCLVTLAPELPGAVDIVRQLTARGIVVAAGHTDATTDELLAAMDAGISHLTHLCNAMRPLHHREPGPVGLALGDPGLTAGLIVDGRHVHPRAVAAIWSAMGRRVNVVSDATALLGAPGGRAVLDGTPIRAGDGVAVTDDGTFAGSTTGLDKAVRNLVASTGCPVDDAIATVTSTAARVLRRPSVGRLAEGDPADLVLLDERLDVVATLVAGAIAYWRGKRPASVTRQPD